MSLPPPSLTAAVGTVVPISAEAALWSAQVVGVAHSFNEQQCSHIEEGDTATQEEKCDWQD